MNPLLQFSFCLFGSLFIIYGFFTNTVASSKIGSYIIMFFGVCMITYVILYTPLQFFRSYVLFHLLYCILLFFFVAFIFSFIITSIIIAKSAITDFPATCDAIIVLGAGLKNDTVSLSLASRLDTAYFCHLSHPNSIIIVSGGLGTDETKTEAIAMKNYLLQHYNLPSSSIIIENKSRRTLENFQFSKVLLDNYFPETYTAVYVTNDFHMYRSSKIASLTGIHARGLSAPTTFYLLPNCYVREYLAIIKFYLKDNKK